MSITLIASKLTRTTIWASKNYILRCLCEANDVSRNMKIIQSSTRKSKFCLGGEKPSSANAYRRKEKCRDDVKYDIDDDDLSISLVKIKALQERFQRPDGIPVFLKMGIRDQLLYRLTMLLALGGLASIVKMIVVEMK